MEYSNFLPRQRFLTDFWNMEYSKKFVPQQKYENFGIWNIPGIFQKQCTTTKNMKIVEYGIFHGILLEYSKKSATTLGGVKFNHGII